MQCLESLVKCIIVESTSFIARSNFSEYELSVFVDSVKVVEVPDRQYANFIYRIFHPLFLLEVTQAGLFYRCIT